jgi:hypothetical protein
MKTTHPWLWRFLPALLVVAVLAFFLYLRKGEQPPSLPARLGEMGLAEQFEGATAQWMIDQLHGRGVTPRENIIGLYEGGGVRAALYVSGICRCSGSRCGEQEYGSPHRGAERGLCGTGRTAYRRSHGLCVYRDGTDALLLCQRQPPVLACGGSTGGATCVGVPVA